MDHDLLLDKYTGCMLGVAIGDALGMPSEGMTPYEVMERMRYIDDFMPSPDGKREDGTYTGVAQVAMLQAMALVKNGGKWAVGAAEAAYASTAERGQRRWDPERDLEAIMAPLPFALKAASSPVADASLLKICGASVRTCYPGAPRETVLGGFCVAWLAKEMVRNGHRLKYLQDAYLADGSAFARLVGTCREIEHRFELEGGLWRRMEFARRKADSGASAEEFVGTVGNGWDVGQAVPFGMFCFLTEGDDVRSLFKAASMGGASPLAAGIAGALAGAYAGAGLIKDGLRAEVENSAKIVELARQLWRIWVKKDG